MVGPLSLVLLGVAWAVPAPVYALAHDRLLEPQEAFRLSARPIDERTVAIEFRIADGYYMYRDRFGFATASGEPIPGVRVPRGTAKEDQFFGRTEVFREMVSIWVPLPAPGLQHGRTELRVTSQGCWDGGVCYAPVDQVVAVEGAGEPVNGRATGAAAWGPRMGWAAAALAVALVLGWRAYAGGPARGHTMSGEGTAPKRKIALVVMALVLLAMASAALGNEDRVRRMLEEKLGAGDQLESVRKAPFADLYEAVVRSPNGAVIYYVDSRATVIIAGRVIDAGSGRDLTDERLRQLNAVRWESLPLQWAITMVRGDGRRKIAVLSDPNCPYCKRLEEDLARLDDITVHILPYPVLGPESVRLTKSVWCSRDRVNAWNDLMFRRVEPSGGTDCDTPIEKLQAYGRSIRANSTPTWFLENGERYTGALPVEEVRRRLDAASPRR